MKRRIAVEGNLENVKHMLITQGYEVSTIGENRNDLENFDAIVISGQDQNLMGITETYTRVPVIDATGKSPEQVYDQLKERLR